MPTNDNEADIGGALLRVSDHHGQAALVLVESLIHGLVERSVLTTAEAIDIIDTAKDVQAELADTTSEGSDSVSRSHTLLTSISESLHRDVIGEGE